MPVVGIRPSQNHYCRCNAPYPTTSWQSVRRIVVDASRSSTSISISTSSSPAALSLGRAKGPAEPLLSVGRARLLPSRSVCSCWPQRSVEGRSDRMRIDGSASGAPPRRLRHNFRRCELFEDELINLVPWPGFGFDLRWNQDALQASKTKDPVVSPPKVFTIGLRGSVQAGPIRSAGSFVIDRDSGCREPPASQPTLDQPDIRHGKLLLRGHL